MKRFVSLLVVLAMIAGLTAGVSHTTAATTTTLVLTIGKVDYMLNGTTKKGDQAPVITDSRTFVPIRLVSEAFGADVNYDAATKKVAVLLGATSFEFIIGQKAVKINGDAVLMDAAAYISKAGRTLIPIRFISEKSGLNVAWNATAHTVTITSKAPLTTTVKIGLVTDVGGRGDQSFNDSAMRGLETWAAKKSYVKGGGYTAMTDAAYKQSLADNAPDLSDRNIVPLTNVLPIILESKEQTDYIPNLTKLAEDEGCALIVAVGFMLADATYQVAKEHPKTKFMLIDAVPTDSNYAPLPTLPNLVCFLFKEEQCGFLVGAIAGYATKANKIGYIGGIPVPPVQRYEAGFFAGIKTTNKTAYGTAGANVSNVYAGSFGDQPKGKQIAQTMLGQKCDILFHAAGATGNGMFEAIKEAGGPGKGLWGIGVDVDMGKNPNLYPAGTLTSALKHVDFATYISVKSMVDGTFTPGVITLSLRNGGVGWAQGNVAKVLSAAQIAKINTLRQDIIDGKITPPEDPTKVAAWTPPTGY
ncbi:MAG: BMP family ABC transporter substrate-binding protein [Caldiserica bacterium]|nr:BMP family ABC transporter substrate-binding protein [Caldisericota bacterium]